MRSSQRTCFLILIIFILLSSFAFGWTEPRRLTDHLYVTNAQATSQNRKIFLAGWPGPYDFWFLTSWNNGYSWSNPSQPADTFPRSSEEPDIECTPNGLVHVLWIGYYGGNSHPQIFHQSSSDDGRHWSNRHPVFSYNGNFLAYPRLATSGDTLFLVYIDNYHMRFYESFDDGNTWQGRSTPDTSAGMDYYPNLLYSQSRLHLIYELTPDTNTGSLDIFYSKSNNDGQIWSSRIPISTVENNRPYFYSMDPSAYADENGHIVVTWYDYKYGTQCDGVMGEILARVSTDNGDSWLPESRVTHTQTGWTSSCLILGNIVYSAWVDFSPLGCDLPKIMLSNSSDWGVNWSNPEVITGNGHSIERYPFLLYSIAGYDTFIHCFYDIYDTSYGTDIYYVRSKPFFVTHIPLPPDQRIYLSIKAYPNVFNSSTLISIDNEEGGDMEIEIYNVLGQRIWNKSVDGKEGTIIWDARDKDGNGISSGTYFVRATTKSNTSIMKLLYLK